MFCYPLGNEIDAAGFLLSKILEKQLKIKFIIGLNQFMKKYYYVWLYDEKISDFL